MGFSFGLAAVKELRKKKMKKVRSKADRLERSRMIRRAMAKPDSKLCGFEKIHEHLFMEILVRFPVKPVTRLKCVSKLWYSLISSRRFTMFYLEAPSPEQRRRLLISFMDNEVHRKYVLVSSSSSPHDQSSVFDQDLNIPD